MCTFTIEELRVPARLDGPGAADFVATVEVGNAVEAEGYGSSEFDLTPAELLPDWLDTKFEPKRLLAARVDGRIVARAIIETRAGAEADVAWLQVQVHPAYRRRGIGGALSNRLEEFAADGGTSKLIVYVVSKDGPGKRLTARTGFGSVPRRNSEVQFLLNRGYALEQVERASRLALPIEAEVLQSSFEQAAAAAGAEYAVHHWVGKTPERWREDISMLLTRMSTDAPTAGLEEPEDTWTVDRIVAYEEHHANNPRTELTAAVEHVPSGRLVGFTELTVPAEPTRAVRQEDTIVIAEHRGNRLGTLLKVANLTQLQAERPGHPAIVTFNAEENRHILEVNEALGFVRIGYEGAWQKIVK